LAGWLAVAMADKPVMPATYDEAELKKQYEGFLLELNSDSVATDYPKTIRDLLSGDPARQETATMVLGQTGELGTVPWLAKLLDAKDDRLRTMAASAIETVISSNALKRRDQSQPDRAVLRPRGPGDPDLHAFAWLALRMFRMDGDASTCSYACTVARYIEAREFGGELRRCLQSKHPAVSRSARDALEALDLSD